jgi:hypothetical protein
MRHNLSYWAGRPTWFTGILALLFLPFFSLNAHPSWGLVVDSKGLIYFVDVLHNNGTLWCFDPDERKLKALIRGNFHAHSLQIDAADNLYIGTQLWIEGEIMGDGQNYLFRYNIPTQQLDTLVYSEDYDRFFGGNVLVDASGSCVFYPHKNELRVHDIAHGSTKPALDHQFDRFSTMRSDKNGNIWISDSFADDGSIYSWHPDRGLKQVAGKLFLKTPTQPVYSERNHWLIYGMDFSPKGNLVYCESAYRSVHEILPNGKRKVLYQSPEHYFPTGVFFAHKKMYVMEVGYHPKSGHSGPRIILVAGKRQIKYELVYDTVSD